MAPSSIRRFVVTCGGYQRSGQLIARRTPDLAAAARIRSASASEAANGFSSRMSTPSGRDSFGDVGMPRGRRTEDGEVGPRLLKTALDVAIDALPGNGEIGDRLGHARFVLVADGRRSRRREPVRLAQEVAHMRVLEADAGDPLLCHPRSSRNPTFLGLKLTLRR